MPDLRVKVTLEGGQFKSETGAIDNAVGNLQGKISASFDSMIGKVTAFSFTFNEITNVISQVVNALAVPIRKFSEFETAIANVGSLGVKNVDALSEAVLDLSSNISVPLENLSGGLYEVVSAGVDANNQISVLEASAKAAKAGLAQTTEALQIGSAVIKGYSKEWSDFEAVMDQAFTTVNLGQTTFSELSASAGQVIPIFSALQISTNELFGAFATLTGVTGNTSEVATQLKAIATGLADPTDELTELITSQGFASVEAAVAQKGLAGVLEIVAKATQGSAAKMTTLFSSVESVTALLALTTSQYDDFIEKTAAMENATGSMNAAFEIQSDTMASKLQLLSNQWDRLTFIFIDQVVPAITAVLEAGSDLLDWVLSATSETDSLAESLETTRQQLQEFEDLSAVLNEYETLKSKTELTADEQQRLKEVTDLLAKSFPGAIDQVNQYGDALSVNAPAIRAMIEQQQSLLRVTEFDVFEGAKEQLKSLIETVANGSTEFARLADLQKTHQELMEESIGNPELWLQHQRSVENVAAAQEQLRTELAEANIELPRTLALLSNFENINSAEAIAQIAAELKLSEQEASKLNEEIEKFIAARQVIAQTPATGSPTAGGAVGQPEQPSTSEFSLPLEKHILQTRQAADLEAEIWQSLADKRISYEQDVTDQSISLNEDKNTNLVSGLDSVLKAFGVSYSGMFGIGKAGALAETQYNTYAAAQAAYKALAGIPIVGPALGAAAAAAAIAAGFANVVKIQNVNFEKKYLGGLIGNGVASGSFGLGENRLFAGNDGEYVVNRAATSRFLPLLDAINRTAGTSSQPGASASYGAGVSGNFSRLFGDVLRPASNIQVAPDNGLAREFSSFRQDTVRAIREIKIDILSDIDTIKFFRDNLPEYEKNENRRRI
jgi:TP901 family phage tail tape measure protein